MRDHGLVNDEPLETQQPDDEAVAGPAPAPAPAFVLPRDVRLRPLWTYFLTPIAVVIGAVIIAGAVWYTNDDSSSSSDKAASVATPANESKAPTAAAATSAAGQQQDLLTVFRGYVQQLGMDQSKFNTCLGNKATADLINKQLQRGAALGVSGTPTFFINNKMLVGAQPPEIFDEIVKKELAGSPTSLDGYSANVQALAKSNPPNFSIVASRPDFSDGEIEGNANAKVVIVEFSDFQCPFCKRWTDQNMTRVRGELGDQVAFVFLHFPITQIHPNAGNAALAAQCAAEQGKFWPMHDILFAKQNDWAGLRAQ